MCPQAASPLPLEQVEQTEIEPNQEVVFTVLGFQFPLLAEYHLLLLISWDILSRDESLDENTLYSEIKSERQWRL